MYDNFKNKMARKGAYMGEVSRNQSDVVVNATWMNSVSTYPVVVYSTTTGLPPMYTDAEEYDEPFYAHFEEKSKYNAGGNTPAYYLTFAPGVIHDNPNIKVGSYVNIPLDGICAYWLIINISDDNELPQCQVIKCNWTLKWVFNGIIYNTLCVLRSSSDSSGIETAGQLSTVDSVMYIWAPTNSDISKINYNTRFLISDVGRVTPLAWKTSKIFDVTPIGLTRLTLDQDMYNNSVDNANLMLADYNVDIIDMTEHNNETQEFSISYNGTKPTVKVGSSKIFTANLLEDNHFDIMWSVIDGASTYTTNSYDNTTQVFGDYTLITTDRTLQLKVAQNYDLVEKVLTVRAVCANGDVGEVKVEVIS